MNIIVCIRQTPDTESRVRIAPDGRSIETEGIKWVLGPYDEYSHEAAVQLKEQHGGTVTALSFGPERVKEALRQCLAVGADRAIHIDSGDLEADDSLAVARALAAQISRMEYDLIFTSTKGVDTDRGQVGAQLAELLGIPYTGPANELELEEGGRSALVVRDAEGGRERIRIHLPAVVCGQKGIKEPRYASLMNIMKAKKKPIDTVTLDELGVRDEVAAAVKVRVEKMEYPPPRQAGKIIEGESVSGKVAELIRLLREEAKVI